ncbi:hypothetical protein [Ralstonia syzygii]|uniref:Uncharacterized protein n=1 Tax=Ralstonia syzygii R24 TaxID=907261 RepID=G3A7W6_9RALS|nr:hypothetical protein [Ralstonia syzygii]CCA86602.1 hypothetical protein RALSY_40832 [Ralstonia syzygii R24]
MRDVFEPKREPALSIYNAFQAEATKRHGRSVEEWIAAERDAVFRESVHQAQKLELRVPSMEDVMRAERYAVGSVDYGAKWAYGVVRAMNMPEQQRTSTGFAPVSPDTVADVGHALVVGQDVALQAQQARMVAGLARSRAGI